MKPIVTVGLDSRAESLSTARWAAREAQSRGAVLRILHARAARSGGPDRPADGGGEDELPRWIMERARTVVDERCPGLPVTEELSEGDPVASLLEAAGDSQAVVLGSRDMAPLASYYLGDIGLKVLARADTPVVLVRAREATGPVAEDGAVVLGLSLHGPCEALCEFAFDIAARRGVLLRAVHGRSLPEHAYGRSGVDSRVSGRTTERAQLELGEALRPWREKFPQVRTAEKVRMESPAHAVVRGATGAGLLVVGRRRSRPALSPPVGHALSSAVHHAPCPVAVVPHD
ncbi:MULTISPECIES: universal stress protein [unclassified Streptomyces]|uniref:universal stress protein n=1 Tax=unclassified Streptomyces TaxID=2593676 RepID=UPI002E1A5E45|nr:universal stress protein [Streptomyces sp. NBC_01023]